MSESALDRAINRRATADEVREACLGPITDAEREHGRALIRWFTTRYPSPGDRLGYVRLAYARWRRSHATATSSISPKT